MEDVSDSADPESSNGVATVSSEVYSVLEERGEDMDVGQVPDHYLDSNMAEGGYECKYCSFQTAELNLFTMHVDTEHPDVVINTSYVCMECDYHTKRFDFRFLTAEPLLSVDTTERSNEPHKRAAARITRVKECFTIKYKV